MKRTALSLLLLSMFMSLTPALAGGLSFQGIQEGPGLDVDVDVDRDNDAVSSWPVSPVWMAVGALAFLVVVALIVMAVRGNTPGTTVVHR